MDILSDPEQGDLMHLPLSHYRCMLLSRCTLNARLVDVHRLIRSQGGGGDEAAAQCPSGSAAHGPRRIRMARLCYDMPSDEALPFLVDMLDKTLCALSEDFSQEQSLYKPLVERFRRNIRLLEACIQEKSPLIPLFGFEFRCTLVPQRPMLFQRTGPSE